LQEFEKAVEGLEEMIVVVDRDYRCVIANRAYLSYRGVRQEDLNGRPIRELLNPGVFETTVKDKLDECFRGSVVQYEMRYRDPIQRASDRHFLENRTEGARLNLFQGSGSTKVTVM